MSKVDLLEAYTDGPGRDLFMFPRDFWRMYIDDEFKHICRRLPSSI